MALSVEQLDAQAAELLPNREVMSTWSWGSGGGWGEHPSVEYTNVEHTETNVLNGNDVLSNNHVSILDGGINVLNGNFSDNKTLLLF